MFSFVCIHLKLPVAASVLCQNEPFTSAEGGGSSSRLAAMFLQQPRADKPNTLDLSADASVNF